MLMIPDIRFLVSIIGTNNAIGIKPSIKITVNVILRIIVNITINKWEPLEAIKEARVGFGAFLSNAATKPAIRLTHSRFVASTTFLGLSKLLPPY
jgi:hypothetical protein